MLKHSIALALSRPAGEPALLPTLLLACALLYALLWQADVALDGHLFHVLFLGR